MNPVVPPPVDRAVFVNLPLADAFALFTDKIGQWWPFVGHSCSDTEAQTIVFEPQVGGAVTEIARSGERFVWGTLSTWHPPHGFVMSWHPGIEASGATRLRVDFTPRDGGTEVRVVHDGWEARGAGAAEKRDQYDGGWPAVLARYAAAATGESR